MQYSTVNAFRHANQELQSLTKEFRNNLLHATGNRELTFGPNCNITKKTMDNRTHVINAYMYDDFLYANIPLFFCEAYIRFHE